MRISTLGAAPDAGLPPGPDGPTAALADSFTNDPEALLARCAEHYGPVFTLRLPGMPPMVVVGSPSLIARIFHEGDTFSARRGNRRTSVHVAMGENFLMALDGDRHSNLRDFLFRELSLWIRHSLPVVRELLLARIASWPVHRRFSLADEMRTFALELMLTAILGLPGDQSVRDRLVARLRAMLRTSVVDGRPSFVAALFGYFHARDLVYEMLDREVALRVGRGQGRGADLLSKLLDFSYKSNGQMLTSVELRDQLFALSVTGHDTTAATLGFAFDELLREPKRLDPIRSECAEIAMADDNVLQCINGATNLDAVLNEVMRLHPVSAVVNRETTDSVVLGNWRLPAGTMVCPALSLAHRSAEHWRAPGTFDVTRDHGQLLGEGSGAFAPFGGGNRQCIGRTFARHEMKLVLALVLHHTHLVLHDTRASTLRRGFVLTPGSDVPVTMVDRRFD